MTIQYHVNASVVLTDPTSVQEVAALFQGTVSDIQLDRDPEDCTYVSVSISTLDVDEDAVVGDAVVIAREDVVGNLYSGDTDAA
jgi:hypothetical protein